MALPPLLPVQSTLPWPEPLPAVASPIVGAPGAVVAAPVAVPVRATVLGESAALLVMVSVAALRTGACRCELRLDQAGRTWHAPRTSQVLPTMRNWIGIGPRQCHARHDQGSGTGVGDRGRSRSVDGVPTAVRKAMRRGRQG